MTDKINEIFRVRTQTINEINEAFERKMRAIDGINKALREECSEQLD